MFWNDKNLVLMVRWQKLKSQMFSMISCPSVMQSKPANEAKTLKAGNVRIQSTKLSWLLRVGLLSQFK